MEVTYITKVPPKEHRYRTVILPLYLCSLGPTHRSFIRNNKRSMVPPYIVGNVPWQRTMYIVHRCKTQYSCVCCHIMKCEGN